jgi:ethanolaminephosphotransferase
MLLAPLGGGAILAWLPLFGFSPVSATVELGYLWAYFLISVVVYFRWAFVVINAICDYLGIQCLTIPEAKYKALERERDGELMMTENSGKAKQ